MREFTFFRRTTLGRYKLGEFMRQCREKQGWTLEEVEFRSRRFEAEGYRTVASKSNDPELIRIREEIEHHDDDANNGKRKRGSRTNRKGLGIGASTLNRMETGRTGMVDDELLALWLMVVDPKKPDGEQYELEDLRRMQVEVDD